jgi:hypothetical protein
MCYRITTHISLISCVSRRNVGCVIHKAYGLFPYNAIGCLMLRSVSSSSLPPATLLAKPIKANPGFGYKLVIEPPVPSDMIPMVKAVIERQIGCPVRPVLKGRSAAEWVLTPERIAAVPFQSTLDFEGCKKLSQSKKALKEQQENNLNMWAEAVLGDGEASVKRFNVLKPSTWFQRASQQPQTSQRLENLKILIDRKLATVLHSPSTTLTFVDNSPQQAR